MVLSANNSLLQELTEAFPSIESRELSDIYIREHSNLLWSVPEIPLIKAVPLYMLWCIEHFSDEGELVFDETIQALNTYSREKSPKDTFKSACSKKQVEYILSFLYWCKTSLLLDYEPSLDRAIKNWSEVLAQK